MLSVLRFVVVVLALAPLRGVAEATPRAVPGCPGYASLMSAAADALRQGDQQQALEKLRAAREALDRCSRGAKPQDEGVVAAG